MRRYIAQRGYPGEVLEALSDLLEAIGPEVVPEPALGWRRILETAQNHRLMSNDALIALAALEQGIELIISFDEDFDHVPWLERIH